MVESPQIRRWVLATRYILLTVIAAIMVYPFAYMISTSLKTRSLALGSPLDIIPTEPTLQNYVDVFRLADLGRYIANSAFVSVTSTLLIVFLASLMAFAFSRLRFPGRRLLFISLVIGLALPTMMLIIPQFILARDLGLLNSTAGLIPFYVGTALAFHTFLLTGFFSTVPRELEEAMIVDGAGLWRRYWNLIVPLSRPAIATCIIFAFLGTWDEFAWALTTLNDESQRTLPVAIALFRGQYSTDWGMVFAASIIAVLPVIVVYIIFQRQFVAGLTTGGLKQ
ncbi:MAG: carbohydrate ABC transporter permease [Microcella sp.]|uniref:carbohydrate ABC transporter permease n=1 Tax=Microcella sp. TaxID=1913979 RepID=UPI0024C6F2F6|nr:carbohydrate ABC transporter permease [Microcella sp.]UYN83584.1 MAG: carbohydrate ABC transporter permease [Microcella sp.]